MRDNQRPVIGAILLDQRNLYVAQKAGVTADTFTDALCKSAWNGICSLASKNRGIDCVTVAREMGGEQKTLEAMIDATPSQSMMPAYVAGLISEDRANRATSRMVRAVDELAKLPEIEQVIDETISDLMQLNQHGDIKVYSLGDLREEKVEQWKAAREVGYVGVPFCLPAVNKYLGGWRNGCVGILGGYRGEGKSTLARQDAYANAMAGRKVALFSLEDPADISAASIAARHCNTSTFYCDTGEAHAETIAKIDAGWKEIGAIPLHIISANLTMTQICSTAQMLHMRYKLDIMYIDHIQYVSPLVMPHMTRNDTLSNYSLMASGLAKRLNIPVVLLAQLNRDAEKNNRKPRLSDIRDCGSLEQDARQVLLLSREQDSHVHNIEVAKNNFGISGKDTPVWRLDGKNRFTDEDPKQNDIDDQVI